MNPRWNSFYGALGLVLGEQPCAGLVTDWSLSQVSRCRCPGDEAPAMCVQAGSLSREPLGQEVFLSFMAGRKREGAGRCRKSSPI